MISQNKLVEQVNEESNSEELEFIMIYFDTSKSSSVNNKLQLYISGVRISDGKESKNYESNLPGKFLTVSGNPLRVLNPKYKFGVLRIEVNNVSMFTKNEKSFMVYVSKIVYSNAKNVVDIWNSFKVEESEMTW